MIIVKNRQLLFSNREQYIGTSYDSQSTTREFVLDRINEDGTDLASLNFHIDMYYYDTGTTDSDVLTKVVREDKVILSWVISSVTVSHTGTIRANLRAYDTSGLVKWSSYQNLFYVEDTDSPIDPPEGALSELERYERLIDGVLASEAERVEAETGREEAEAERVLAEGLRQQTFETNEQAREDEFSEAIADFNRDRSELATMHDEAVEAADEAEDSATAAANSAAEAASYSRIVLPHFHIDFTTMELIQDDPGAGISFWLSSDKELMFEYT